MSAGEGNRDTIHRPVVLVTGAAGYLGRVLVHELLRCGREDRLVPREVRALDREDFLEAARRDRRGHLLGPTDPRLRVIRADLCDAAAVQQACRGVDVVIHSAAQVDWGHCPEPLLQQVNVGGTDHVVQASLAAGVSVLVYTSTEDVVFTGRPIRDADERIPYPRRFVNGYCRTKADAEVAVLSADGRRGAAGQPLRTVALRPVGIWGEGDPFHISALVRMAQRGLLVRMGDGRARCQHVYVHNVAHAHLCAARALLDGDEAVYGQIYFVTDSAPANFFDYLEPVIRGAGLSMQPWRLALPRRPMYALGAALDLLSFVARPVVRLNLGVSRFAVRYVTQDFTFNGERARRELGYQPVVPEDEAISRTAAWFRQQIGRASCRERV